MQFRVGAVPEDFEPDDSWHSILEPGPLLMQLLALPVAIFMGALFWILWQQVISFTPMVIPAAYSSLFAAATLASIPLLIMVHELLHAAAHPGYGLQSATVIGAWPKMMLFYAHYSGPLTRNRFLLVFAMPFLCISVLPLVIASFGWLPQTFGIPAAWFSIWNALFACGDALGFFLILAQVPRNAIVQNKGWRSYWQSSPLRGEVCDERE